MITTALDYMRGRGYGDSGRFDRPGRPFSIGREGQERRKMMQLTPNAVRIIRQFLGWTCAELSRRSGVSAGLISMIERGDRNLLPHNADKIAQAFGLDESIILTILELEKQIKRKGNRET
jgi:transcriptional regulator with XRE-family HTH domain